MDLSQSAAPEPESTDPRSGPFPHDEQFGGEAMMLLAAQVSLDRVARGANPEWVKAQAQAQYDQALADMRRKGATEQQIKDIQDNIAARRATTDAERAARAGGGQQATPEPQATGDVKPGEPGPHPSMTRLAAPVPTKPGERTEPENHLLIVQCSDTKTTAPGEVAALDRYDGPFARTLRALKAGSRPTILFISGKFGLVGGDQPLPNYDQALNPERVDALQRDDEVTGQRLEDYINEGQFESVLLLGGQNYRAAIGDHLLNAVEASENTPPSLEQPTGDLLALRKELGSWLRAIQPDSPPRYATQAGPRAPAAETTGTAPAAKAAPPPGKREQTAQGKAAQKTAVEAIRSASIESPVGQWMGQFEARVQINSPVMAAVMNRVPAPLKPFIMRAAYAGIETAKAADGVEAAKKARLEAIQRVNSEAVAAMKGDGNQRNVDRALSRQFAEDLTFAYNRGEDIAGQMQEEGKAIPEQRQIEVTTRTARGQETNYKFGSAAAADQTAERLSKLGGATFYSFPGMLFDPQAWAKFGAGLAHVGRLLLGDRAGWEQFSGAMTALGTSLKALANGAAKGPAFVADASMRVMERTLGAAVRGAGGALRAVARTRNSEVLMNLANDLDAPSRGMRASETGQRSFNIAFRIKRNLVGKEISRLSRRLDELVSSARREPGESTQTRIKRVEEQLARQIRNPGSRRGELGKLANEVAALLKGLRDYAVEAGVELGNVGAGYLPRTFDADTVANGEARFREIAEAAYRRQGVPAEQAKTYANELLRSVREGGYGIPGHSGAFAGAPASVKSRTFDKTAEDAFQEAGFYVNELERLLLTYRDQIIRRAEIARRWGDQWKNWEKDVIGQLQKEPGNDDSDLAKFAGDYAETITGTRPTASSRGASNTVGIVRAATNFTALGEAALTSLLEATAAGQRTGRADEAVRTIVTSMTEAVREIFDMPVSEQRKAAEELGLIAGDVLASAQAGRFGSGDGTRAEIARKEARFFRFILLEQITNGQYVSVAQSGMRMLDRAARGILGDNWAMSPERGKQMLNELGVPMAQTEAFARAWQQMRRDNEGKNTRMPTAESYATPMGGLAQTALYTFVTQVIQTPDAGSKPRWASTTFGSLFFNLNSFAWAFARNVTIANVKHAKRAITGEGVGSGAKGLADRAAYMAPMLLGTMFAMMSALVIIKLKDAISGDDDDIRRRTKGWWWEQVARRSGLLMLADPIIQASAAGIYGREPVTSISGASVGIYSEALSALNAAFVKNSPETNAVERRLTRALWDAAVAPGLIMMILASRVPGAIGGISTVAASSKAARRGFVDAVAGKESPENRSRRINTPLKGYIEHLRQGNR